MTDQLQRFIFEDTDIRGELTRLQQSYQDILSTHQYPQAVSLLLGEFLAAAALLSATLKFEGSLTLQASSEGEIPLIMAEASSDHTLRAIAHHADNASSENFNTLLANGRLTITITPRQGQRYQGIVALEHKTLAQCLEGYFQHSEQLPTRIWLGCNGRQAAGLLLQELPATQAIDTGQRQQDWQHTTKLAETLTRPELLSLPFDELLHRLYHQERVRLFEPQALCFKCSCSRSRTLKALQTLGQTELEQILSEQKHIEITCEFCRQHYRFNARDIQDLLRQTIH